MDGDAFDAAFDRLTAQGWLSRDEALMLIKYAELTEGPIVEVGSYCGRSAMMLGSLGRLLYCIDPWADGFNDNESGDELYAKFHMNMARVPGIVYAAIRSRVEDWSPVSAEFVYLDGDHTADGTRVQISQALKCRPKYIAIHDVNDRGEGVAIKDTAVKMLGKWVERVERLAVWDMKRCLAYEYLE